MNNTQNIAYLFAKPVFTILFISEKQKITKLKGDNMDIENIVSLTSSIISLIGIIIYAVIYLKNSKKTKTEKINLVLEKIKKYVNDANTYMPEATTNQKINYIVAEIKDDLQNANLKLSDKKIKEKVEEKVE